MQNIETHYNVRDVIKLINENKVHPVMHYGDTSILFDTSLVWRGEMLYTVFNLQGNPVESYSARYGAHHTMLQVVANPLPRTSVPLAATELPENPEELTISQVLAGYKD